MIHTGGIGDFILTCPAIERLSKQGPVTLAGNPDRLQLAVAGGIAAKAVTLDSIRFDSLFSTPHENLIDAVAAYDRIIIWMNDGDQHIASTLKTITNADVHVFPGLPPETWTRHASEYYLNCLGLARTSPFGLTVAPSITQHDIIIHPGSGSPHKNWPIENFIALSEQLKHEGRSVAWCVGPAERERIDQQLPDAVLQCDSLSDIAANFAAAKLYIGNDSGITHLAAAVGTPTVALFGPTNPDVWAPCNKFVTVLKSDPPWPSVDDALNACHKFLT